MAPPLKKINEKLLQQLANAQLTDTEIAKICGCSVDTLGRRYADTIKEARIEGVACVRRRLYTTALSGSKGAVTCMIFFLKNYGDMADNQRVEETRRLTFGNLPVPERTQPAISNKPN